MATSGGENENRFRVRESVKPGLAVVVTDAGISDPAKGMVFDKQVNVYLIDRAAARRTSSRGSGSIAF